MRPVPFKVKIVCRTTIILKIMLPTRQIHISHQPLPRTVRIVVQFSALLHITPSGDERASIIHFIPVGRCRCGTRHLGSGIACFLSPFTQTEIEITTLKSIYIGYQRQKRIAARLIHRIAVKILSGSRFCFVYAFQQMVGIVCHHSATKFYYIVEIIAFMHRAGSEI